MKNIFLKLKPVYGLIAIAVLGFGSLAYAGSTFSWSRVEDKVAEKLATQVPAQVQEEENLGAVTGPDFPNPNCTNNNCQYVAQQTFIDASTTIVSIVSPFRTPTSSSDVASVITFTDDGGRRYTSPTTTVDLVRLNITGAATTSFYVACGAASAPTVAFTSVNAVGIVSSTVNARVATSTVGFIENNLSAAAGALSDGGTVNKIAVGPGAPYLNCVVSATDATGFTNALNTFDGKATVRFSRTR